MSPGLGAAHTALVDAVTELETAAGPGASDDEQMSVLTVCEGAARRLDRIVVDTVADLSRRGGVFAERGYRDPVGALCDLLGWERFESRARVLAAEHVCDRVSLDGTRCPPRLPATAAAFAAGAASLRHVEVIARVLASPAATRLGPEVWTSAEEQLAAKTAEYTPTQLRTWGLALVELLDADGERDSPGINELFLSRNPSGSGGRIKARFDDAALFDAIAAVVDAGAKPADHDDDRPAGQRAAEALADACAQLLDHAALPETAGRRPHLNVIVSLEELENRARNAWLDFGGGLTPSELRRLCCDAAVVPIVMDGNSQPLDVGRSTRTIPDGLRRAVHARDRGCAHPGCGHPVSWTEIHHIIAWELDGPTSLDNCVALCRVHHRLLHADSGWTVRIRDGIPEFVPPRWIDPRQQPRRRPPPPIAA